MQLLGVDGSWIATTQSEAVVAVSAHAYESVLRVD